MKNITKIALVAIALMTAVAITIPLYQDHRAIDLPLASDSAQIDSIQPPADPPPAPVRIPARISTPTTLSSDTVRFSEPPGTPVPAYSFIADNIANQLTLAQMAFAVPTRAHMRDIVDAELIIDTMLENKLVSQIGGGSNNVIAGQLQVSKVLSANLTSRGFDIQNITPNKQALVHDVPTRWRWSLKPLTPGVHRLHLTVTAIVKVDDEKVDRNIITADHWITVEITAGYAIKQWLSENWQWAWSALLVPAMIAAWTLWRRHRRKQCIKTYLPGDY